ncbi:MAG TPA: FliH/SctL family protein [Myxococcota bacterium]|nr:FliH/SctL family protein [Myxococcota bacterium]
MPSSSAASGARGPARFVADPLPEVVRRFERAVQAAVAAAASEPVPPPAAEPTLEEACARAREEGYAAGRAELPWSEAESLRTAIVALEHAAATLAALRRAELRAQRRAIVELAVALAEGVLRREVRADRDALAGVLERALAAVDAEDGVRLRLSARDLAALEAGHAPELARIAAQHGLSLQGDPSLSPGDLRLASPRSDVDARLHTCVRRLADELGDLLEADEVEG